MYEREVTYLNYILFTINGCINCVKTKKLLEQQEVAFLEKNIIEDLEARNELKEWTEEIMTPVLVNLETKEVLKWDQIKSNF